MWGTSSHPGLSYAILLFILDLQPSVPPVRPRRAEHAAPRPLPPRTPGGTRTAVPSRRRAPAARSRPAQVRGEADGDAPRQPSMCPERQDHDHPAVGKVSLDGYAPDPGVSTRVPTPTVPAAHEQCPHAGDARQSAGAPGDCLPGPAPPPAASCALSPPSPADRPLAPGGRDSLRPHRQRALPHQWPAHPDGPGAGAAVRLAHRGGDRCPDLGGDWPLVRIVRPQSDALPRRYLPERSRDAPVRLDRQTA